MIFRRLKLFGLKDIEIFEFRLIIFSFYMLPCLYMKKKILSAVS